jgi:HEAT repeat protein
MFLLLAGSVERPDGRKAAQSSYSREMVRLRIVVPLLALAAALAAQQAARPKDVREAAKAGPNAVPRLAQYLTDPSVDVRAEAVKQIIEVGPPRSLDPLVVATRDADAQIQILATDGLVNFYLPGYFKSGVGASLRRVGTDLKGRFTDTNDQVIDRYITVRPEVVTALVAVLNHGATRDAKANAARALGVLRASAAVDDLVAATHSKDSTLIYETVVALEKIRVEAAAPHLEFLMNDLDPKVQAAAIEAVGLLRDLNARPGLIDVLNRGGNIRVKRTALTSLAMLPAETNRAVYQQYIRDKDDKLRASAAEGFARLRNPVDTPMLDQAWKDEVKPPARLALAFALVMHGQVAMSEFSPLQFLVTNLDSASYSGIAQPYLTELARDNAVRAALYGPLGSGTKLEKIGLAQVLSASGDRRSLEELNKLKDDPNPEVAQAALTAVRNLQSRL